MPTPRRPFRRMAEAPSAILSRQAIDLARAGARRFRRAPLLAPLRDRAPPSPPIKTVARRAAGHGFSRVCSRHARSVALLRRAPRLRCGGSPRGAACAVKGFIPVGDKWGANGGMFIKPSRRQGSRRRRSPSLQDLPGKARSPERSCHRRNGRVAGLRQFRPFDQRQNCAPESDHGENAPPQVLIGRDGTQPLGSTNPTPFPWK
jgi:hypothetical protein